MWSIAELSKSLDSTVYCTREEQKFQHGMPGVYLGNIVWHDKVTIRWHHLLIKFTHCNTVRNILKITISKWPRLDWLDNGSYSTIQPTTFITYNMNIEVYPALYWNSLNIWVKNWFRLHNKILTKLVKKLKRHHRTPSISPVIILNGILTNIKVT